VQGELERIKSQIKELNSKVKSNKMSVANNFNPSNTKLSVRVTEIKINQDSGLAKEKDFKLFYSLSDGD
jgi:hypothetical protein